MQNGRKTDRRTLRVEMLLLDLARDALRNLALLGGVEEDRRAILCTGAVRK